MHLLGVLHAWEERGGACVPGPGARFLVRRLFPRLASSSSVRRTCAVRESGPGVAPRRAWGCEGSAGAVPPFFVLALALGGREGDSCEGLCERRVSSAVEQSAPVRSVVSSNPARVSWLS